MSVQVENLEKNMAKLTIEVAAEKVEDAIQAAPHIVTQYTWKTCEQDDHSIDKCGFISAPVKHIHTK